jgi:hypothetical protein
LIWKINVHLESNFFNFCTFLYFRIRINPPILTKEQAIENATIRVFLNIFLANGYFLNKKAEIAAAKVATIIVLLYSA